MFHQIEIVGPSKEIEAMLQKIITLCFICMCSVSALQSQERERQKKSKSVVVPTELVLLTIAAQPESPLEFDNVRFLAGLDGGGSPSFVVRNRSSKPIRSFTVGGVDWSVTWPNQFTKRLLMPGEVADTAGDVEIVKLSPELQNKLNLQGPMRSLLVLMVIKVEFADESIFNAEPTYHALQQYSDKLADLSFRKPK
jgi:hypothetical protein